MHKLEKTNIEIRLMVDADIATIVENFARINWPKPASLFETYLSEQHSGLRIVWVAHVDYQLAGYVTLAWKSKYESFAQAAIPEIMDLNVLPQFRAMGVSSQLLDAAEKEAATKSYLVGIGVGLYGGPDGGYGAAQRLYVKRGYVPDGKGVTYAYKTAVPGNVYPLDDDLILWFIKQLK